MFFEKLLFYRLTRLLVIIITFCNKLQLFFYVYEEYLHIIIIKNPADTILYLALQVTKVTYTYCVFNFYFFSLTI